MFVPVSWYNFFAMPTALEMEQLYGTGIIRESITVQPTSCFTGLDIIKQVSPTHLVSGTG